MRVSVIINTANRERMLRDCLAGLKQQSYQNFEVIVVVGPCTDQTLDMLAGWSEALTVRECEALNLSVSRNIGIASASGDICAFIDDDAIAHPQWLEKIVVPYADPDVGGVGGFTLNNTGADYQCRYTVCDRLGKSWNFNHIDPSQFMNYPGAPIFPSLLGTNSSFRRKDLELIGGFDEVFAYMLDETDVCLRLNDLGRRIVTVPGALVLHRYAASHTRNAERIPNSLLASVRSKAYYGMKHRRRDADFTVAVEELNRFVDELSFSNRWFIDHKKIEPKRFFSLNNDLQEGVRQGIRLATQKEQPTIDLSYHHLTQQWKPFPVYPEAGKLRVCFVSQGYPPRETAGIARWTHALASGLVSLGHEVHVIAATNGPRTVEYEDGSWIHRVPNADSNAGPVAPVPVPDSVLRRCLAVYNEAKWIKENFGLDVISAPIWDVEGLLCVGNLGVPVATSLHTTYKLALPFKEHWRTNLEFRYKHVERVIQGELWLLQNSDFVLGNSRAIVQDIEATYRTLIPRAKLAVVPHGVEDASVLDGDPPPGAAVRLLYVGRLEQRKGIDLLLEAAIPLLRSRPDVELHVVGEEVLGDPEFDQKMRGLRMRISAERLDEAVTFHGYVNDLELQRFYRDCDIFVAPSRFESFGLIAIEAMRYGKPVIAANVGGLKEIFEDGVDGLLFELTDVGTLRAALSRLVEDVDIRRSMGLGARARFEREYTIETMAQRVAAVYGPLARGEALPVTVPKATADSH